VIEQDEQFGRLRGDRVDQRRTNAAARARDEERFSSVNDGSDSETDAEVSRRQKLIPIEGSGSLRSFGSG